MGQGRAESAEMQRKQEESEKKYIKQNDNTYLLLPVLLLIQPP